MSELLAPVEPLPQDVPQPLEDAIAVSLSGGGYTAMLFHVGALWRLAELGILSTEAHTGVGRLGELQALGRLSRVSSVSGGSITSAVLALSWEKVSASPPADRGEVFRVGVAEPIRRLARISLAGKNVPGVFRVLRSIVLPGSVNEHLARSYARHLYGRATLKSLPDTPRFVINAANLQSGALWRFSNPYVADWRVGRMVRTEKVSLAHAVAASSAFPPVLAPAAFCFEEADFIPRSGGTGSDDLCRPPFTTRPQLVDGGVYDNLGIETTYKRFRTLLVSNGGAPFDFQPRVARNWVSLGSRVIGLVDLQVLNLRKRLLIGALKRGERQGAFWDIEHDIAIHGCPDSLPCPFPATQRLAAIATDLARKDEATQERLINWGYAVADAALRANVNPRWPRPAGFPYPRSGVG
jgi:NTE family protein